MDERAYKTQTTGLLSLSVMVSLSCLVVLVVVQVLVVIWLSWWDVIGGGGDSIGRLRQQRRHSRQ